MTQESKPPQDEPGPGLPREVRRHVLLSWLSLAAERLYPVVWPAGGVVGAFLVLALANVFVYMPAWLHLLVLAGLFCATAWAVAWSLRQSSIPTHAQAIRHLERTSGLSHRPLSALEDRPAIIADNDTRQLWRAHQRWVVAHLSRLKVGWPALSLTSRDPHAIRVLLGIAIAVLGVANWDEVPSRLQIALSPGVAQGQVPATVEAWVTPPAHTGEAPKHLTSLTRGADDERPIRILAGSVLTVRTHGAASAALRASAIDGPSPRQLRPQFLSAGGDARDAKLVIDESMTVRLSMNANLVGLWRFEAAADTAPKISFKSPVAVMEAQSLRIHYAVADDYGVVSAQAHIELAEKGYKGSVLQPLSFDLPLPPAPARNGDAMVFKDLTSHPWAGLKVSVRLSARDEPGQAGRSPSVVITLPEKRFNDPLARALIEQRRNLARDPSTSGMVAAALDALTLAPERFLPDTRVYLAMRTAAHEVRRIRLDAVRIDENRVVSAQALLWDIAVRVEEGDVGQAQAELRDIQRKLMDALAKGAPDAEIDRLMAQLRAALERNLKALADRAGIENPVLESQGGQMIRPQDLKSMIDQIEELARQGSKAAAQQKLSELLNLLESVQTARGGRMSPEQQQAAKTLEQLGQIATRQRELMDQTFREQQSPEQPGGRKPSTLKGAQEKLSDELSPIIKQMSRSKEMADALKRAQDAMDDASDELGAGDLGPAVKSQQRAIDELRKGGRAMAQQLMQQMTGSGAMMPGSTGAGGGDNEDPFGRPQAASGPTTGNSVKVPDKSDIQKAREILQELQRRAAERGRPDSELEYIERLLRRF